MKKENHDIYRQMQALASGVTDRLLVLTQLEEKHRDQLDATTLEQLCIVINKSVSLLERLEVAQDLVAGRRIEVAFLDKEQI